MVEQVADILPFKQVLRKIRGNYSLTQKEFGSILGGISRDSISKMERGITGPPRRPDFYAKIAQIPIFEEKDLVALVKSAAAELWGKDAPRLLAERDRAIKAYGESEISSNRVL